MTTYKKLDITTQISIAYFFLLILGVFQVYSASSIYAMDVYSDSWYFVKKQALFAVLGAGVFLSFSRIKIKWFLIFGGFGFFVSFLALLLTLHPSIGKTAGGATRWLELFSGFRIEPGEFVKVSFGFLIFWLLSFRSKYSRFSFWWPFTIFFFAVLFTFIRQPDFGSIILLTLSTLVVMFFLLKKVWPFLILGLLSFSGLSFFVMQKTYRYERLLSFLDPWRDPQGKGYQVIQSLMAFRKGGFLGEGIGMSEAKFFFLPEAHTDFTLAVFAEEWGFVGVFILLLIFMKSAFNFLKLSKDSYINNKQLSHLGYYLACFSLLFLSTFL